MPNKNLIMALLAVRVVAAAAVDKKYEPEKEHLSHDLVTDSYVKLAEEFTTDAKAFPKTSVADPVQFIEPVIQSELEIGKELLDVKAYDEVIKKCQKLLEHSENSLSTKAKVFTTLAVAQLGNGEVKEAISSHNEAVRCEPQNAENFFQFGQALVEKNSIASSFKNTAINFDLGLEQLKIAYQLSPHNKLYLETYVRHLMIKNHEAAFNVFYSAVPKKHRDIEFYKNIFQWSLATKRYATKSIEELEKLNADDKVIRELELDSARAFYDEENFEYRINQRLVDDKLRIEESSKNYAKRLGPKTYNTIQQARAELPTCQNAEESYIRLRYITLGLSRLDALRHPTRDADLVKHLLALAEIEKTLFGSKIALSSIDRAKSFDERNSQLYERAGDYKAELGMHTEAMREYAAAIRVLIDEPEPESKNHIDELLNKYAQSLDQVSLSEFTRKLLNENWWDLKLKYGQTILGFPAEYISGGGKFLSGMVGVFFAVWRIWDYITTPGIVAHLDRLNGLLNNITKEEWDFQQNHWWLPVNNLAVTFILKIKEQLKKLPIISELSAEEYLLIETDFIRFFSGRLKVLYGNTVSLKLTDESILIKSTNNMSLPSIKDIQKENNGFKERLLQYESWLSMIDDILQISDFAVNKVIWDSDDGQFFIKGFVFKPQCRLGAYVINITKSKEAEIHDVISGFICKYFRPVDRKFPELVYSKKTRIKFYENYVTNERSVESIRKSILVEIFKPLVDKEVEDNKEKPLALDAKLKNIRNDYDILKPLIAAKKGEFGRMRAVFEDCVNSSQDLEQKKPFKLSVIKIGYDSNDRKMGRGIPSGVLQDIEEHENKYKKCNSLVTIYLTQIKNLNELRQPVWVKTPLISQKIAELEILINELSQTYQDFISFWKKLLEDKDIKEMSGSYRVVIKTKRKNKRTEKKRQKGSLVVVTDKLTQISTSLPPAIQESSTVTLEPGTEIEEKSTSASSPVYLFFKNIEPDTDLVELPGSHPELKQEETAEETRRSDLIELSTEEADTGKVWISADHIKEVFSQIVGLKPYLNKKDVVEYDPNADKIKLELRIDACHFRLMRFNRALREKFFTRIGTNIIHYSCLADFDVQQGNQNIGEMLLHIHYFLSQVLPEEALENLHDPFKYLEKLEESVYKKAVNELQKSLRGTFLQKFFSQLKNKSDSTPLGILKVLEKIKAHLLKLTEYLKHSKNVDEKPQEESKEEENEANVQIYQNIRDAQVMRILNIGEIWTTYVKANSEYAKLKEKSNLTPEKEYALRKKILKKATIELKVKLDMSDKFFRFLEECAHYRNMLGHNFDLEPNSQFLDFVRTSIEQRDFISELDELIDNQTGSKFIFMP